MDFGVARLADAAALTAPGDVVGTLAYMSPEQAEGRAAGPEADVYSLALMLYECWSGENPNRRATPAATARAIGARPRPLRRLRPDLPRELCDDDRRLPAAARPRAAPPWRSWAARSRTRSTGSPSTAPPTPRPLAAAARRGRRRRACSAPGSPSVTALLP